MTIYEFEALTLNEKAEAVWLGTFLADREEDGFRIQLYSLPGCYVEVFYDAEAHIRKNFPDTIMEKDRDFLKVHLPKHKVTPNGEAILVTEKCFAKNVLYGRPVII